MVKLRLLLILALAIAPLAYGMEVEQVKMKSQAQEQKQLSVQDLIDRNEFPAVEEADGYLDLSDKGLTSLFGLENVPNPEQITGLFLENNKIAYIPDHAFDRFPNLKNLNLMYNPIIQIQPGLFDMLLNLEELHLEDTSLVEIPPKAFDALRKLKVLHLFNNKLESIPADAITNLIALEEFDIHNNKIEFINPNFLENQPDLKVVNVSRNKLSQLPSIMHLKVLKELHIAENPEINELSPELVEFILKHKIGFDIPELLGEIPPYSAGQLIADLGENWQNTLIAHDEFGNLVLNLDNKGLTDLSGVPQEVGLMGIAKLSAKNNFIKRLPADLFYSYNSIEQMNIGIFPNLQFLDLSNNILNTLFLIAEVPGGSAVQPLAFVVYCPILLEINLAHNRITEVPSEVFNGLRKLIELNLSNNLIGSIEDGALSDLGNLEELYLESNKLHVLPTNLFKHLNKLRNLLLMHNNLGNKDHYVFPRKAKVIFYPQEAPLLKLLAAKKIAESFERKNLIEVYKALQGIPEDWHANILAAASKNSAKKIKNAMLIQGLFGFIAKGPDYKSAAEFQLSLRPKNIQEAMLALAPEAMREELIKLGIGENIPGQKSTRQRPVEAIKLARSLEGKGRVDVVRMLRNKPVEIDNATLFRVASRIVRGYIIDALKIESFLEDLSLPDEATQDATIEILLQVPHLQQPVFDLAPEDIKQLMIEKGFNPEEATQEEEPQPE